MVFMMFFSMLGVGVVFPLSASAATAPTYYPVAALPRTQADVIVADPMDVAEDRNGNRYVLDEFQGIVKFDRDGNYLTSWHYGVGDELDAIAVSPRDGTVFAVECWDFGGANVGGRIHQFTADGQHLLTFGAGYGSLDGQLLFAQGIAVDDEGSIYVADTNNHRIQKFGSDGVFIAAWGGTINGSSDDGKFDHPTGVAVDADGYIYVADRENHRVQKLKPNGQLEAKWGTKGSGDGNLKYPYRLSVVSEGTYAGVYIVDTGNTRIQKINLDLDVSQAESIGKPGYQAGLLSELNGIAVDSSGFIHVSDSDRVQTLNPTGAYVSQLGRLEDQFVYATYVSVDRWGQIYVTDSRSSRVLVFNADGTLVRQWGEYGQGQGQFDYPGGVAVDESGYVYVVDSNNNRVQKFTAHGVFVKEWGERGNDKNQLDAPLDIAIDRHGNVYVADSNNNRIQKFSSEGVPLARWGSAGSGDGEFSSLRSIEVDADGYVYVVDSYNHRVQKFKEDNIGDYDYVAQWGTEGTGDGELYFPSNIGVDLNGTLYVTDSTSKISMFDSDEASLTPFIGKWSDMSIVAKANGIAVSGDGTVIVIDYYNHQVRLYQEVQPLADLAAVGGNGAVKLTFSEPTGATAITAEQSGDGGLTWSTATTAAPLTTSSTSATVTGLTNGTTYHFRLSVTDGLHDGVSNAASATPQAPPPTSSGNGSPPLSGNANLKSLAVSVGTLSPAFDPATTGYTVKASHDTRDIAVTAVVSDPRAKLRIGQENQPSGEQRTIALAVGKNSIEVEVLAENGDRKTYTIEAVKAEPPDEPTAFSDLDGHWAQSAIVEAAGKGLAHGYPDGTFRPDRPVTRAEFAAFIARALGWSATSDLSLDFADRREIPVWAQGYIAQAAEAGFISGYDDGTFRADRLITRTEAVSIIVRVLGHKPSPDTGTGFADNEAIPAWGRGYVRIAEDLDIVAGRGGNRFEPAANLTRAEAIVLLPKTSKK